MEHRTMGIDVGHCESAAAFPRQVNMNDRRHEVRRLVAENKDQVISTQIILTDKQMRKLSGKLRPSYAELCQLEELGEIKFGNKLPEDISEGEKFRYFKVPPRDFDKPYGNTEIAKECGITHGQIMVCYIFALINSILKHNREDLKDTKREDIILLVGCPTTEDWTNDNAKSTYAELIKKATNVKEVRIIPESRAAMFSSVENEKNKISALKGAVVFDFGSSTADCTYMLLGRKIVEFSWTLGASEIERQMTLEAYQTAARNQDVSNIKMTSFADVEDDLRVAKEAYYDHRYGPKGHAMFCCFQTLDESQDMECPLRINDAFMKKITSEKPFSIRCDSKTSKSGTWTSLCEAFFTEAKRKIQNSHYLIFDQNGKPQRRNCEIDTIVLTGGACKMDFVYELCKKVFTGVTIQREDNPSHTVSNGLGWVAVSDENLNLCQVSVKNYIDSVPECSFSALRNSLEEKIFNKIRSIAESCTEEWANAPGDTLTLKDLDTSITNAMESDVTKKGIISICSDTITDWKNKLSAAMETAVNTQVSMLYSESVAKGLIIPPDIWKTLQASSIRLDAFNVDYILKGINVSSVGRQIAQWFIVSVAATIGAFGGIFGAIAGAVIGSVVADLMADGSMDKPRKRKKRLSVVKTVKSEIAGKKTEILKNFSEDIRAYEPDYTKQVDDALMVAFEIVTLKRFEM